MENTDNQNRLTKEDAQDIVDAGTRTMKQEVTELVRYPGLKLVSRFARTFGLILAIVFLVLAIVALFVEEGAGAKFLGFFSHLGGAIVYFALGLFFGDFCQVFVDIEENTRKK